MRKYRPSNTSYLNAVWYAAAIIRQISHGFTGVYEVCAIGYNRYWFDYGETLRPDDSFNHRSGEHARIWTAHEAARFIGSVSSVGAVVPDVNAPKILEEIAEICAHSYPRAALIAVANFLYRAARSIRVARGIVHEGEVLAECGDFRGRRLLFTCPIDLDGLNKRASAAREGICLL